MNSFLLNRQLAQISPQALSAAQSQRLLSALQLAPAVRFGWTPDGDGAPGDNEDGIPRSELNKKAHAAGVNAITIDRFEGR